MNTIHIYPHVFHVISNPLIFSSQTDVNNRHREDGAIDGALDIVNNQVSPYVYLTIESVIHVQ